MRDCVLLPAQLCNDGLIICIRVRVVKPVYSLNFKSSVMAVLCCNGLKYVIKPILSLNYAAETDQMIALIEFRPRSSVDKWGG